MSSQAIVEATPTLKHLPALAYKCTTTSGRKIVVCVAPGAAGRQALREIRRSGQNVETMTLGEALSTARKS